MGINKVVARGEGPPLILLPGIQGRWEWMEPAIRALSRHYRVLTFSLNDVGPGQFFDGWMAHIDRLVDEAGGAPAALVGVSFGGVIAVRYAATRPERLGRLVLVSSPGPSWRLDAQTAAHVRRPLLRFPLFAARAVGRLAPETTAALPAWTNRGAFALQHSLRTLRSPARPTLMAAWVREWQATDIVADARRVVAPTLVITGEPELDRVVPVASSLEYLQFIAGARHQVLERTGHLGLLLRPDEFAADGDRIPGVSLRFHGPAGVLEALIDRPAERSEQPAGTPSPRAAVVFAHPHPLQGGTMHTKTVFQGAKGLARSGCAVLRFNFRGVGASTGSFDAGPGELDDFRAAITFITAHYPGVPVWAAGFSFGSWVALEVGQPTLACPCSSALLRLWPARNTSSRTSSNRRSRSSSFRAASTSRAC